MVKLLWSLGVLSRLGKTMWQSYDVVLLAMRGKMGGWHHFVFYSYKNKKKLSIRKGKGKMKRMNLI